MRVHSVTLSTFAALHPIYELLECNSEPVVSKGISRSWKVGCAPENASVVFVLLLEAEHLMNTTVLSAQMYQAGFRLSLVWLARIYNQMMVLQVSQHHPPSQYVHAQQTASGQLQSAPGQVQAGQAHQHSAPGHLQPAPGQPEILHSHMQPLSQLGSYIDLTPPTQSRSLSQSQPQPHSQSQPGSQVLSPSLGELLSEQLC